VLILFQAAFDKWWSGKFCGKNVLQKFDTNAKHSLSHADKSYH
jgi:hypothetical protein